MSEFPPNLDDGELWLPSNVLGSDDDEEGEDLVMTAMSVASGGAREELMTSQSTSSGSSPSSSEGERGSEAWEMLDVKLKWNEVNWNWDWKPDCSIWAPRKWNSAQETENSATPAKQYTGSKPCPVQAGWSQQTKPKQGCSPRIGDHSYPVWAPVHGVGSGMKAIFLDSNKSGRESGGTGVFLPRRCGNGFESKKKKKTGCSTVLLPYRVVQALNLNIQNMGSQLTVLDLNSWKHGCVSGRKQVDNCKPLPRNDFCEQPKKPFYPVNSNIQPVSPEIRLPQEWTY